MQLDEDQKQHIRENREEYQKKVHRNAAAERIFNCPDGELILKEIKLLCGFDTFIYDKGCDATELAYRTGKNDVCQFIVNLIEGKGIDQIKAVLDARAKAEGKAE